MKGPVMLDHVYAKGSSPIPEQVVDYTSVCVYCYTGSITLVCNGTQFAVDAEEDFDESIAPGTTFEVRGNGTWKGFLRGR